MSVAWGLGSSTSAPVTNLPSVEQLDALTAWMSAGSAVELTDAERIDYLRVTERLICATQGFQGDAMLHFDASQRLAQRNALVRGERQGRGVALQIGLAKRMSHHRATHELATLKAASRDMPHTWAAFRAGILSQWRVGLLVRETACLTPENRALVDVCMAEDTGWLEAQGDKQLIAEARRLAYQFEPRSFVDKHAKAVKDRRVTSRPAPDGMLYLGALLPLVQGVAVMAALTKHADALIAAGDGRSRSQIMADTLVERVTGQATAGAVPIEVGILISERTAAGMDDEPARVPGFGPIPADVAAHLIRMGHLAGLISLRLIYADAEGRIVAMKSKASRYAGALAGLLRIRDDGVCRTPYCGAPIKPIDHAKSLAEGGETSFANGQGLCEACNIAKEAEGWHARPRPGPDGQPHTIDTVTPTGHRYSSTAPRIRYVHRPPQTMDIFIADDFTLAG